MPKPILGVVHLPPLPGSPRYQGESLESLYDAGAADARVLSDNGIDGIIVENAFDLPFARPEKIGFETVAVMTAACLAVRAVTDVPLGITCVANGVIPGLAIAKASGASWVRANQWVNAYVANEGIIDGPAGDALRYRSFIGARDVCVFADVHVKFGSHSITADRSIEEQARDAEFFDADALIASGTRTGSPTQAADILAIKKNTNLPVLIGSGLDLTSVDDLLPMADGAIVGSWFREDGEWWRPVVGARVRQFMDKVRELRTDKALRDPGRGHGGREGR
jgi:membrane complex biogenesis BtpA family protein